MGSGISEQCSEQTCGHRWEAILVHGHTVHVHPLHDTLAHHLDEDCVCGPTPEHVPPSGWLYTHHSLDGRERFE